MTPETLAGLLADPDRLRVLAAVALGARTDAQTAAASGLPARAAAVARHRLAEGGAIVATDEGWAVAHDRFRDAARQRARDGRDEEGEPDRRLQPFVHGRALRSLPAAQRRRREVLEHVATSTFVPGQAYDERAVDERLRPWCDGGSVDHVALRRYLVDSQLLLRGGGSYALASSEGGPPPGPGERYVEALGLA